MKRLSTICSITLLFSVLIFSSCNCGSDVGKMYNPNGDTPCPATLTIEAFNRMIDGAKRSDNSNTLNMMFSGEILTLDVTRSYTIVEQGKGWYRIAVDNMELYVVPHMGKVY